MSVHLIRASATAIPLRDESVQCVVTSPPYWGLRKYAGEQELVWGHENCTDDAEPVFDGVNGAWVNPKVEHEWANESVENRDIRTGLGLAEWSKQHARGGGLKPAKVGSFTIHRGTCVKCGAWRGAYGLEPTVEMYVEHTVQILREIRRVLRKDGVVFWNVGDSYCSGAMSARTPGNGAVGGWTSKANQIPRNGRPEGLKPKDLVLMPARVALAAQDDGWWVRSMIVWAKPNPMPESVTDRPTDAYEHIILLAKSERYFWDATAVREQASENTHSRGNGDGGPKARTRSNEGNFRDWAALTREVLSSRNMRNVWDFATQPYKGAHFATFPEELPRRCILAGTSERGACAQCGTPWRRIVDSSISYESGSGKAGNRPNGKMAGETQVREDHDIRMGPVVESKTVGWQPGCRCRGQHGKTIPCVVLDPFGGSGTTGRVAVELNREAFLLDVAYGGGEYDQLARQRTTGVQRNLLGMF